MYQQTQELEMLILSDPLLQISEIIGIRQRIYIQYTEKINRVHENE